MAEVHRIVLDGLRYQLQEAIDVLDTQKKLVDELAGHQVASDYGHGQREKLAYLKGKVAGMQELIGILES